MKTNATDKHVGTRVRMRRRTIGMSREKLGDVLGLTYHQVQKYETGKSVISAGRLHEIANILGVPVAFFFEGAPHDLTPQANCRVMYQNSSLPRRDSPSRRHS